VQRFAVVSSRSAKQLEGGFGGKREALHQHALCLLDHDSGFERSLQLVDALAKLLDLWWPVLTERLWDGGNV
jgi:hypothetical protein